MLSYARRDATMGRVPELDPRFNAFVELLDERVSQITGYRGFIDRSDIRQGEEWPEALAEALRTAQTLVCLYSPSYFESDYCGKEMQVFLERRASYIRSTPGKPPANIIAVAWQPLTRRVPKTLPDFEITNPNLDRDRRGIWDLADQHAELTNVAHQIAYSVREAADRTPLPVLAQRPSIRAVRSAFLPPPLPLPDFDSPNTKQGPNAVTFVYPSSSCWDAWPWAPPEDRSVLYLAASVAKGREMEATQLSFDSADEDLPARLELLRRLNNVVMLLVDASNLTLDALRARIQDYDRWENASFAVIVIEHNPIADLQARLNECLPHFTRRAAPHFHVITTRGALDLDTRETVAKQIADALEQLKLAVLTNPYAPNFISGGTGFQNLPTVKGPGRLA